MYACDMHYCMHERYQLSEHGISVDRFKAFFIYALYYT